MPRYLPRHIAGCLALACLLSGCGREGTVTSGALAKNDGAYQTVQEILYTWTMAKGNNPGPAIVDAKTKGRLKSYEIVSATLDPTQSQGDQIVAVFKVNLHLQSGDKSVTYLYLASRTSAKVEIREQ